MIWTGPKEKQGEKENEKAKGKRNGEKLGSGTLFVAQPYTKTSCFNSL